MAESYDPTSWRRKWALSQLQAATDSSPVGHPLQALARALQGAVGGYMMQKADAEDNDALVKALQTYPGFGGGSPQPSQPQQPAGDTSQPRGIRNNNPLNIEAGNFTQSQPGFVGSDGRFARFETPQAGLAAADKLLMSYSQRGLNTVNGIVGRWAPTSDGNPVPAYAGAVAKDLGVSPDQPIDMSNPQVRQALAMSMAKFENGKPVTGQIPPPQAPAGADSGAMQKWIMETARSNNPQVRALGMSALQQSMKQRPEYAPLGDSALYDKNTGRVIPVDISKKTNEQREYEQAVSQGYKGSLLDYQKELKQAGASTVTVDQRGENEFSKQAGALSAKRYSEMVDDVPQAKQMLSDVQTLVTLGGQIGTGKEAELKAALGPYAQAMGINIDKLPEIQAYEAILNRVAPTLRVKGSGAQSDFELKNFLKSLPTLGNTPEGNQIAARVMQGLYQNKLKAGEIGSQVLNGEITRKEADKMIRELPDPMQEYRDFAKSNPGASIRPTDEGGWTVIKPGVRIKEER